MNDDTSGASAAAATAFMGGFFLVTMIVVLAITVAFTWLFWRVFAKTGMNGALGLLCLIPSIGPIICLVILAFGRWPIEEQLAAPPGASVATT
jgi:uncharacterized membrane protein YhaH (DUF805 family)